MIKSPGPNKTSSLLMLSGRSFNDLPDSIKSDEVYMYADDTTIYTTGKTTDEVAIALQAILDQLQTLCQVNRLINYSRREM